ncbi:MAG: hypothetical protein NC089_10360 [Bacteroides sp.]|nr:hypothetical protein [Bacteroides sp.]MCM1550464.1 hypothetical protein [Clostridium sp.]
MPIRKVIGYAVNLHVNLPAKVYEYGILTISEIDELDRCRAADTLFSKLKKAEERADKEGWISADNLEKELGVAD